MTHAGEDHGNAVFVGGIDDFLVAHGAAGLDNGGNAGFSRSVDTVPEREECVRSHDRAFHFQAFISGLDTGNPGAVHTAHLAGPNPDGAAGSGVHDGIGFDVLGHLPGKQQVAQFVFRRLAFGHDLDVFHRHHAQVPVLDQQPAGNAFVVHAAGPFGVQLAAGQQAHVLFGRDNVDRLGGHARGDDHLHKLTVHNGLGRGRVQFAVERDDTAKSRGGIGSEGQIVGLPDVAANGDAAGVGMFDNHAGRVRKRLDAFQCGVGIGDVVKAQLLALQLPGGGNTGFAGMSFSVEGSPLMGVLAVAHVLHFHKLGVEGAREIGIVVIGGAASQIVGDGTVVSGGVFKGFYRQVKTGVPGQLAAVGVEFLQNPVIVAGIHDDGDVVVVLGGRADHGRAPDVDVLDGRGQVAVRVGDRVFKRVEIYYYHVDGADAVFCHHGIVGAAPAQDAAVDFRVQGFYPAVHHLRETRVV